jgi:hypothetical protein
MNNEYKTIAPIEKFNGYILFFIIFLENTIVDTCSCGPEWFLAHLLEINGEFQQAHNNLNQLATQ